MRFMNHTTSLFLALLSGSLVVSGCTALGDEPPAPSESQLTAAIAQADCVPGGATATDAAIADQVAARMTGRRVGNQIIAYHVSCARRIIDVTRARGLVPRAAVIAVTTAITESSLRNLTEPVDYDSLGLFQQRPSQGWGTPTQLTNPVYATNAFLDAMLRKFPSNSWMTGDIGAICQRVQVSAVPDAYGYEVHDAQLLVDTLWTMADQSADGAAPDFDGDGRADLVATWLTGVMTAYRNTGTPGQPAFGSQRDIGTGWHNITRIAVVDADNDGKRDVLGIWGNGTLTAYLNVSSPGSIALGNQQDIGVAWDGITKVAVVDADNDGKQDLVGTWGNGTLTAYLNTGTPGRPGFHTQMNIGSGWNHIAKLVVVDADNDGKQDLVATWASGTMTAYLNTGTPGRPGFGNQRDIGSGWTGITKIVVVDADHDGKQDLVATWTTGTMTAYLNTGTRGAPGFGVQVDIGTAWTGITKIVVADADNDGKQDLVGTWDNGTMTAYLNTGSPGRPGFHRQTNIGAGWTGITKIATVH